MEKFFLYARKSTDVEDKQILSIEAQLTELRAFAKQEKIEIVEELVEKQSAKIPGRPLFNKMISRIEGGEATGILAWHPDRLARNSVDGGRIIYLLDCGQLTSLKFPTFWFEPSPQGKFMLNIAFGQSKYYVDNLSENTKRGLRQKVRRGEYPSLAPLGYINDSRTKTVTVDEKCAAIIRQAFELYTQNKSHLEDISHFLAQNNITSRNGKALKRDRISFILSNPFYIGLFRYAGELHEGKHEPVITKKTFDRVQEILHRRSRPRHKSKNEPKPFCGLLTCAECKMGITAEIQKGHVYYRCTKKGKQKCSQPYVRQEELDRQVSHLLQTFSLPEDWALNLKTRLKAEEKDSAQSSAAFVQETKQKIQDIQMKLQRLLDGYLEQDIEREIYRDKKAKLLSEKKSLEEQVASLEQKQFHWLEPFEKWIREAQTIGKTAQEHNLLEKKAYAKEIFGSNLHLSARKVSGNPQKVWEFLGLAKLKIGKFSEHLIRERVGGIEPPS